MKTLYYVASGIFLAAMIYFLVLSFRGKVIPADGTVIRVALVAGIVVAVIDYVTITTFPLNAKLKNIVMLISIFCYVCVIAYMVVDFFFPGKMPPSHPYFR